MSFLLGVAVGAINIVVIWFVWERLISDDTITLTDEQWQRKLRRMRELGPERLREIAGELEAMMPRKREGK